MKRLLLLSNSTHFGGGYLDHAMTAILEWLGAVRRMAFVPFAIQDQQGYLAKVEERFRGEGVQIDGVTSDAAGRTLLESAHAVFVGGGNTFRLLAELQRSGLLHVLKRRAEAGLPYLGASAGTNVAAPTLRTTNDMPIVEPPSFAGLGLVPFQINPHYQDPEPASTHMGETREQRIREFLEENETPVIGLREGSWLSVEGEQVRLMGPRPARVFRRGADPLEVAAGSDLGWLGRSSAPPAR
jgi:dipeptidase E